MNPYLNKGMITNPEEFYGREEEIENIYERITTSQNTFIVGARGLGKSSLLSYLYHKKDKYLDHPERYIFLFIGIQRDNISTPQGYKL
jgi:AAA+ ATPase superfamily predicted ATPase